MQCPLCPDSSLEPKFVGATEVDICPRCRGIWLDRGELDRLLGDDGGPRPADRAPVRGDDRYDRGDRGDRRDDRSHKPKKSKAKRLADLFEEVLDF